MHRRTNQFVSEIDEHSQFNSGSFLCDQELGVKSGISILPLSVEIWTSRRSGTGPVGARM